MAFKKHLERAQSLPHPARRKLAFSSAVVGTLIVGSVWLSVMVLEPVRPMAAEDRTRLTEIETPFAAVSRAMGDNFESLKDLFMALVDTSQSFFLKN